MNTTDYVRFFDLVGNDSVNETTEMANEMAREKFMDEIKKLIDSNPQEYQEVYDELLRLADKFFDDINVNEV